MDTVVCRGARAAIAAAVAALVVAALPAAAPAAKRARPDLSVKSLSSPPAQARPGDSFKVTARVRNKGRRRAKASVTRFVLSRDRRAGKGDVRLAAKRARVAALRKRRAKRRVTTLTIPPIVAPGTYRLLACADGARRIRERRERNNCRAASGRLEVLAPLPPDQVLGQPPPAPPAPPAAGDTTAPAAPALAVGDLEHAVATGGTIHFRPVAGAGFTLAASAADAESGIARVRFPALGAGWSGGGDDTAAPYAAAYAFAPAGAPATALGEIVATNGAGLVSGAAEVRAIPDAEPPVTTATCDGAPCGTGGHDDPVTLQLAATDEGAGVDEVVYTLDGTEPTRAGGQAYAGPIEIAASTQVRFRAYDRVGNQEGARTVDVSFPVPDPEDVAPAIDPTVATSFADAVDFLWQGDEAIQQDVEPGAIERRRVSVVRGRVRDGAGDPLEGVRISVLDAPELGHTATRADGAFDLALNGGGTVTVEYEKPGFLPAQRQVEPDWRDYAEAEDVVLLPVDDAVTEVDLGAAEMQVARGSAVTDDDGARRATMLFPAGTQAVMELPDGSTQPLDEAHVRATEYTVGDRGQEAMPGELPPASGYTYAVELSVDEAMAAGATDVRFDRPVPFYLENFLGFPAGGIVPAGYYDREQARWVASENGRVVAVVEGGLDVTGDGVADSGAPLDELGIDAAELARVEALYAPGQSLWRVPVRHFTPWDHNWPYGPPANARRPNPDRPRGSGGANDSDCERSGSIVDCQAQVLGEEVPIAGTPWSLHYRSDRVEGGAGRKLQIPVTGASVPDSVSLVKLEIHVAGRVFRHMYAPAPNLVHSFVWDGRDAYGRRLRGRQPVRIRVGWTYPLVRYSEPAAFQRAFGMASSSGVAMSGLLRGAEQFTSWQSWETQIGSIGQAGTTVGGWTLSPNHAYDPAGRTIHRGDGTTSTADELTLLQTRFAGTGTRSYFGDGGPAPQAHLDFPSDLAAAADGSVYIADLDNHRLRRVSPGGVITTVAGNGESGVGGDGGPATEAQLHGPSGVAIGPDGSLYVTQSSRNRVRRVAPDGTITTFAGTGVSGYAGDGGPAAEAQISGPDEIAAAPDGSVYVADAGNERVRRVAPDGTISTFAGGGADSPLAGGQAAGAALVRPSLLALDPDGSVLIGDAQAERVYRVGADGRIALVAGNGGQCTGVQPVGPCGDGDDATSARIDVNAIAVDRAGVLYIGDWGAHRIRRVGPDGVITSIAGSGSCCRETGQPILARAARMSPDELEVGPDGTLYAINNGDHSVQAIRPWLDGHREGEASVASPDGLEVYDFDAAGRHTRTRDARTGAEKLRFTHAGGLLTEIEDGDGNVTRIERDAAGLPEAIVAPGGQRTELDTDAQGYLSRIENPAGEAIELTSRDDGLLTLLREPGGAEHRFDYDEVGLLVRDEGPGGRLLELERTESGDDYSVEVTTALERSTTYAVEHRSDGTVRTVRTDPTGAVTTSETLPDGSVRTTYPTGMQATVRQAPDPLMGMAAAFPSSIELRTPAGKVLTQRTFREIDADPATGEPERLEQRVSLNFTRDHTTTYDFGDRTLTSRSPEGRESVATLDARGRLARLEPAAGIDPIELTYDDEGRIERAAQGDRSMTYAYDDAGRIASRTDATGRVTSFEHDAADRLTASVLPGERRHAFGYDAAGDLDSVELPGGGLHELDLGPGGELTRYAPPGGAALTRAFDADGLLSEVAQPGGTTLAFGRDTGGRPTGVTHPHATVGYEYAAGDPSDRPDRLTRTPAGGGTGQVVDFAYDGELVTEAAATGLADGSYGYVYDSDFEVTSYTLAGAGPATTVQRDRDGLLTREGAFTLTRDGPGGALSAIGDGTLDVAITHDALGRLKTRTHTVAGTQVYALALEYDAAGHVRERTETVAGTGRTLTYRYDAAGRLEVVEEAGAAIESYTYDAHDNRTSATLGGGAAETATYDAQDRLEERGGVAYEFDAAGFLTARGGDAFDYSPRGELLSATAGGVAVTYGYDALGRRVSRTEAGQTTSYLYGSLDQPLRVTATRAPDGTLTTYSYDDAGMLHAIERGGTRYYVATDQLGSPRVVTDTAGTAVKRIDYDAWGVRTDSDPAFELAIGFAGGIDDARTGLVRFGMRDYDPAAGRWTARDPALFGGGQGNLYAYVHNDPATLTDPSGLVSIGGTLCAGVCGGTKLSLTTEGVSVCFEVGFGVGASVNANPFGGLDGNTETIGAEVSASAGILGTSASLTLDECGNLKGGLGASLGPVGIDQNLALSGFSHDVADATGGHAGFKSAKLGAQAKLTGTVCRRMLW